MNKDNTGCTVKVHYIGTLDDGTKFDSSYDRGEPLEFVCMQGQMIKGFDKAVVSMEPGEKKTVRLECEEAYGEYNPEGVQQVPIDSIPNGDQLPVGKQIYMNDDQGFFPVQVVSVEDGIATFDLNHPLAGKALNFEIELLEVIDV